MTSESIKACCADLYASDLARLVLGDSFHPGGIELTQRLGVLLGLGSESRVLDLASGRGASALHLARRFGCQVVSVDYSIASVGAAREAAERDGLTSRLHFQVGDAEDLAAFADASFDAVLCECAFCTFPDKPAAIREIARVLRPGGRFGLSDLIRRRPYLRTCKARWHGSRASPTRCQSRATLPNAKRLDLLSSRSRRMMTHSQS